MRSLISVCRQLACVTGLAVLLCITAACPSTPQVTSESGSHEVLLGRQTLDLNGTWRFRTDPVGGALLDERGVIQSYQSVDPLRTTPGELAGYATAGFDDSRWAEIEVPGNWDTRDEYSNYFDNAWYRRSFFLLPQQGKKVSVHFGAVYYQAEVWLNGVRLGHHIGGATPFEFDITDHIAQDGRNTIAVRANNLFRQGAWWPWGGISRDVRVTIDSLVSISRQSVVATPNLATGAASVEVRAVLTNGGGSPSQVSLSGELRDPDGVAIASLATNAPVVVPANGEVVVTVTATLSAGQYEMWHFDAPNLYFSYLEIADTYAIQDRFGFRHVDMSNGIFKLNGEVVRLTGFNRISDSRAYGSVEPIHVVRRDLDRMKACGTNFTRMMHEVLSKDILEYADEIGILLIEEVPVWGRNADLSPSNTAPRQQLREMIDRDINHPSIVAWSIANEIPNTTNAARAFVSDMVSLSRSLDPSRPVTYARIGVGGLNANDAIQFTDFPGVNLYNGLSNTSQLTNIWPNRPVFVTEFSRDGFSFPTSRETLEHNTANGDSVHVWDSQRKVMAASVWSFNDYRSEFRGTSPNETRGWGVQDGFGNLKFAYSQAQAGFAPVSDLSVGALSSNGTARQSLVSLTPRDIPARSIPSFTLRGYRLLWQALGRDDRVLTGQVYELDDIAPGSARQSWVVEWNLGASGVKEPVYAEKVSLLSPTGHEVRVATSQFGFPAKPQIEQILEFDGGLRVLFSRVAGATRYEVEVTSGGRSYVESVRASSFADVTGLPNGQECRVRVIAFNRNGVTYSIAQQATPASSGGAAPPIVQAVVPVENGFVLGFINDSEAVSRWEVEIVDAETGQTVESYATETVGATRNDRLDPGHRYRVRIRKAKGGAWSEFHEVTTFGRGHSPDRPTVLGVLAGERSLGLRIQPHPQAIAYRVQVQNLQSSDIEDRVIERAGVDLLHLDGLALNTGYRFRVRVETAGGLSAEEVVIGTTALPRFIPVVENTVGWDHSGHHA